MLIKEKLDILGLNYKSPSHWLQEKRCGTDAANIQAETALRAFDGIRLVGRTTWAMECSILKPR
jgi:hypothetical protein